MSDRDPVKMAQRLLGTSASGTELILMLVREVEKQKTKAEAMYVERNKDRQALRRLGKSLLKAADRLPVYTRRSPSPKREGRMPGSEPGMAGIFPAITDGGDR